jgi:protein involved in polysaccharide export with SLBB domain
MKKSGMNKILAGLMIFFLSSAASFPLHAEEDSYEDDLASLTKATESIPTLKQKERSNENEEYVLHAGDRVNVKIYPEDDYIKGGEMQVSSDGNITLALAGKIPVEGKTVSDAEDAIAKILDADYLVNPEVVLEVLEFKQQSFVVLGQVKKPGTFQFPVSSTRLTLLEAISLAGGFSDIANIKKIKIIRSKEGNKDILQANAESIMSGDSQDIPIEPGDIINVSESLF